MAEYEPKVKKITTTDNGTAYDIPRPLKKDIDVPRGQVVMKDTADPTRAYKLEITNGQLSISPYTLVTDADIPIHTV